jgi:DNA-binding HxlR family transcriptional regulator
MTDHPCKGMTKAQIATFERIAINQPPYASGRTLSDRTLKALLDRGLIERVSRENRDPTTGWKFEWWEYHVPLPIHMRWCEWCSQQPDIIAEASL